jgi:hypothetical protein
VRGINQVEGGIITVGVTMMPRVMSFNICGAKLKSLWERCLPASSAAVHQVNRVIAHRGQATVTVPVGPASAGNRPVHPMQV